MLRPLLPRLARVYGIRPWEVDARMRLAEIPVFLDDLARVETVERARLVNGAKASGARR